MAKLIILIACSILLSVLGHVSAKINVAELGAKIFYRIEDKSENIVFSPISAYGLLGATLLGVEPGSQSESQLLEAMSIPNSIASIHEDRRAFKDLIKSFDLMNQEYDQSKIDYEIGIDTLRKPRLPRVNWRSWVLTNAPVKRDYSSKSELFYNATTASFKWSDSDANEQVSNDINRSARELGFMNQIVRSDGFSEDDQAIALQAVLKFKAFWSSNFESTEDTNKFFNYGQEDSPARGATRLSIIDEQGKYIRFSKSRSDCSGAPSSDDDLNLLNFQVIEIPLVEGINMVIFEPLKTGPNQLRNLESVLFSDIPSKSFFSRVLNILAKKEMQKYGRFTMPAIKLEGEMDLIPHLKSIGLKDIFNKGQSCITRISDHKLYVAKMKQSVAIETKKEGVSGIVTSSPLSDTKNPEFFSKECKLHIDIKNPFIFMIRYKETPLLLGHLTNLNEQ